MTTFIRDAIEAGAAGNVIDMTKSIHAALSEKVTAVLDGLKPIVAKSMVSEKSE